MKKRKLYISIVIIQLLLSITVFAEIGNSDLNLGKYGTFVSDSNLTIDNALAQKELPQNSNNQMLYLNLTTNEINKSFIYTVKLYDMSERILLPCLF